MKSLIPLLVLASAVAGAVDIQKRILNGEDCGEDQGRHYVVLTRKENDLTTRFCGGNLISPDWVLTAGHCDKGWFYVILGAHPTKQGTPMQISPRDTRHFFHDNHCHDIMVIKLPKPAPEGADIITLPDTVTASPTTDVTCPTPTVSGISYTIMGWSYTAYNAATQKHEKKADKLQCGTVHLHPACTGHNLDVNKPNARHQWVGQHMLCSQDLTSQTCEGCPGDSGGSLVGKNGRLYGVTVGGEPGEGWTDYMDVCAYRDWIHKVTGI